MFISGATGVNAALVNGVFEPTQEKGLDGRVLYAKRGDASMCIEHHTGTWQVKLVSCMGTDACMAVLEGGSALEACASGVWDVLYESGALFQEQTGVTMLTGQEAQQAVSNSATSLLFPLQTFSFKFSRKFVCIIVKVSLRRLAFLRRTTRPPVF